MVKIKKSILNKDKNIEVILIANKILKKYNKKITIKDLNLSLYNTGNFDSLDFINFIADIEKKFKFKFKLTDLNVNLSLKKLIKLIK